MNKESWVKEGPIIFRGALYFLIAFLATFADNIKEFADKGTAPPFWKLVWIFAIALVPALTSLRAFYDGAAQRHQDKKEANGNTEIINKP